MVLWKREPINDRNRRAYGSLEHPRKRSLIASLPFSPMHGHVVVENLLGMERWMAERDGALFDNVRGVVLVPDDDRVLDAAAMRASATDKGERVRVVEVDGSSHFVLFDRPDHLPALQRRAP